MTSVNISHWKMTLQYELTLIGRVDGRKVVLAVSDDNRHDMLLTASDTPPSPSVFTTDPIDIDLSWLLSNVQLITSVNGSVEELATFAIDRTAPTTRTPRRNKEVDEAIDFFVRLYTWGQCVRNFFTGHVFAHIASADEAKIAEVLSTENIFIPVLPVFREGVSECVASKGNSSCLLTPREVVFGLFLEEENRTVRAKMQRLQTLFAGMKGQASFEEGRLVMLVVHSQLIAEYLTVGIEYIEALLSRQLSAAVGKELTSQDLGKYMDYHNAMMLAPEYAPKPFSYAVRRSADSSPEGQIFIEFDMQAADSQNPNEQVKTIVRKLDDQLMEFSLNAATKVVFGGDRYLHALLRHSFSGYLSPGYSITANARQFSSFILILGRLTSATAIEPTHAIIVKDKDFLRIVLHMETIPSAKEFQDATQSLSSEQQVFFAFLYAPVNVMYFYA